MSVQDKVIDQAFEGAELLAAVLHPTQRERQEAIRLGRERMAHGRSFAQAFAGPARGTKPAQVA